MSAELLALLDSDPAAGILAVADFRLGLLDAAGDFAIVDPRPNPGRLCAHEADLHHVRAAVRRWRGVVGRHGNPGHRCVGGEWFGQWRSVDEAQGGARFIPEPCPDLRETADEARAYLGGAT